MDDAALLPWAFPPNFSGNTPLTGAMWKAEIAALPVSAAVAAELATKQAAGSYASGAQGALADTAVQPAALQTALDTKVDLDTYLDGLQSSAPGPRGASGKPGSVWRAGALVPSRTLGVEGDFYLRTATRDVFQKVRGVYAMLCNLSGKSMSPSRPTLLHRAI